MVVGQKFVPGDVLINTEENTVSYVGNDGMVILWLSVNAAMGTRHPTLNSHYVLVPLQRRFAWLPHTGYTHWRSQALDSNPEDDLQIYIDRVKGCSGDIPKNLIVGINPYLGDDIDAEGDTDKGMYTFRSLIFELHRILIICFYKIPARWKYIMI